MNKCGFEFTIKLRENTSPLDQLNQAITDYKQDTADITEKQLDEQIKEWLYKTKSGKMFQIKMKNTNYQDAIDQMIAGTYNAAESVISLNEIDLQSNISKCFGSNTLFEATRNKEFRRNFIQKLLFYTRTKTEESDQIKDLKTSWGKIKSSLEKYINNNTDDITTDINSMNSKELIDDILLYHSLYGTLRIDNQKLVADFQEIVNSVYNYLYNQYHIVQSNEDLNAAIIEFKETQYKILNKFLLREGYVKSPRSQYINREGNVDLTYVIDLLNKMDEYLNVNKDDLSTKLLSIIKAQAQGQRCDNLLLKAIHAYLNIRHFDETVKSNFGDIINISKYHTFEVSKYSDGKPNIKYFLGQDTSTAVRGWYQGEFRDALSETTKFEKLLIGSLSLIDYKTKQITSDTVDQSKIAMAWYEFIKACQNLTRTDGDFAIFRDIVSKYNQNVNEHITEILNFVFNKGHENILTSLNLPKTTLNIIYSIYSIYLNDNVSTSTNKEALIPIKHVEQQNIINGEITLAKYLYQDIIFGIISRVVPANYQQTRIKDGVETTEIASKHNTVRKDSFDFRESHDIKLRRYTQEQRKKLIVDKYNIRFHYFQNGVQDNS